VVIEDQVLATFERRTVAPAARVTWGPRVRVLVIVDVADLVGPARTVAATVRALAVTVVPTLEREYWGKAAAAPRTLHWSAAVKERVFAATTIASAAGTSAQRRRRPSSTVTEERDADPEGFDMTAEIKRMVEMVETIVSWSATRLDVKNQLAHATSPVVTLEVSIGAFIKLKVDVRSWMYFRGVVRPNWAVL
jgi:hypothetical protein